jgi:hypothetical protein
MHVIATVGALPFDIVPDTGEDLVQPRVGGTHHSAVRLRLRAREVVAGDLRAPQRREVRVRASVAEPREVELVVHDVVHSVDVGRARHGEVDRAGGPLRRSSVPLLNAGRRPPPCPLVSEFLEVVGHLLDRRQEPVERVPIGGLVPSVVSETRRAMEPAGGDEDATERETQRVRDRASFRRERVPKPHQVVERLGVELSPGLSKEREATGTSPPSVANHSLRRDAERARAELEPCLDAGGEDRGRKQLGPEGPAPPTAGFHERRTAPGERVENNGAGRELRPFEHPSDEVGRVSLNVRPPAVDGQRFVRPERDRSTVLAEGDLVLPDESLHERRGVHEVAPLIEAFEVPEDVEAPPEAEDIPLEPQVGERPLDPVRSIVQASGELTNGGADRTGLSERLTHSLVEQLVRRLRHGAPRGGGA